MHDRDPQEMRSVGMGCTHLCTRIGNPLAGVAFSPPDPLIGPSVGAEVEGSAGGKQEKQVGVEIASVRGCGRRGRESIRVRSVPEKSEEGA